MPKMKTNRAAAKRFKETANGRYKYYKQGKSHILTKKTRKRKRRLRKPALVPDAHQQRVRRLLGGGRLRKKAPEPRDRSSTVPNEQHEQIMELLKGEG